MPSVTNVNPNIRNARMFMKLFNSQLNNFILSEPYYKVFVNIIYRAVRDMCMNDSEHYISAKEYLCGSLFVCDLEHLNVDCGWAYKCLKDCGINVY
jgi:hypothetical protein